MVFSDKLVFLMNLVSVNNAELARALHIDPSQISRLRRGARGMPQKSGMVESMAAYFASKCSSDYQYAALSEMIGSSLLRTTAERAELASMLEKWLANDGPADASPLNQVFRALDHVSVVAPITEPAPAEIAPAIDAPEKNEHVLIYYGNEGKRRAMREVIGRALRRQTPCSVMISSDENTSWLLEDSAYFKQAKQDLMTLAQNGSQIQRIIPPLLTINEVFDSFSLWLPLYLTGNVKPYYLRKLRDGIYQRTVLVVPGVAALISTSISRQSQSSVTYVASTPAIVDNYVQEFIQYRAMCSPALTIYDPATDVARLSERMIEYYISSAASIRKSSGLSFLSIPDALKRSLLNKTTSALMRMACTQVLGDTFSDEQTFGMRTVTDIMQLSLPQEILAGEVRYCFDEDMSYTPAEYREHLMGIASLLERYKHYNVVLTSRYPMNCVLYAKRGVGALLFMTKAPYKVMDVTSPATFQGLWEYLDHMAMTGYTDVANKHHALEEIQELISRLSNA